MKYVVLSLLTLFLIGCHSTPTRSSAPTLLKDGVMLEQKKVVADPLHAKVIMKAYGSTPPVKFSVRRAGEENLPIEDLGEVVDTGRGRIFGWIAKVNETMSSAALKRFPQLELLADVDKPITFISSSTDNSHGQRYYCGPLRSTFSPQSGKAYLVQFEFVEGGCRQRVYDITQPNERVPVATLE